MFGSSANKAGGYGAGTGAAAPAGPSSAASAALAAARKPGTAGASSAPGLGGLGAPAPAAGSRFVISSRPGEVPSSVGTVSRAGAPAAAARPGAPTGLVPGAHAGGASGASSSGRFAIGTVPSASSSAPSLLPRPGTSTTAGGSLGNLAPAGPARPSGLAVSASLGSSSARAPGAGTSSSSSSSSSAALSGAASARPAAGGVSSSGAGSGRPGSSGAAPSSSSSSMARRELMPFTLKDLTLSTTVGTGTFGRVRIALHKPSKQWFALKIVKKSEVLRLKQVDHIRAEVKILAMINHPFIVNMMGFLTDDRRLYMLFDYVPGGELFSHLRREVKFSNEASRFYAAEIALAFEYLHTFNIAYRDLKPENLLLSAKGHIKITDFGFAKQIDDRSYTLCGTPEYLAPEIIQSKGHNKGVDWWAIGILIYEMLAGFPPFYDENPYGIYQKILAGKIEWPKHFSTDARDLIKKLLTPDRTRRLGCLYGAARDVKEHPWFAGIKWDDVVAGRLTAPLVPKVRDANDTSNFDDYPDSDGDTAGKLTAKDAELFAELDKF